MLKPRDRQGKPTLDFDGKHIVLADAVALLSGVNFGSVEKVLTTLHILSLVKNAGVPLDVN